MLLEWHVFVKKKKRIGSLILMHKGYIPCFSQSSLQRRCVLSSPCHSHRSRFQQPEISSQTYCASHSAWCDSTCLQANSPLYVFIYPCSFIFSALLHQIGILTSPYFLHQVHSLTFIYFTLFRAVARRAQLAVFVCSLLHATPNPCSFFFLYILFIYFVLIHKHTK